MSEFVLYSYYRSSASFRARIALNLKGIKYEYRAVHLLKGEQFTEDYADMNPSKQVPTLVHNGRVFAQTMAILDYLDSVQPSPRLFPEDPNQRALVTQACEIVNSGTQPLVNTATTAYLRDVLKLDEATRSAWLKHWLTSGSRALEGFLSKHSKSYAIGDNVSAADCFVMPHLFACSRFGAPIDEFPTLVALHQTYKSSRDFVEAMPDKQPDFEKA